MLKVQGSELGFRVWGLGFLVRVLGFEGSGFWALGLGFSESRYCLLQALAQQLQHMPQRPTPLVQVSPRVLGKLNKSAFGTPTLTVRTASEPCDSHRVLVLRG